jgi:hypothetical protein
MNGIYRRLAVVVAGVMVAGAGMVGVAAATTQSVCAGPRRVSIGNVRHLEGTTVGAVAYTPFVFKVTSTGCARAGLVHYSTNTGTAGKSDFVSVNSTVTFASGDLSTRQITVNVVRDARPEPNENFLVVLCLPVGHTVIGAKTGTGTILNDDGPAPAPPAAVPDDFHCSR